MKERRPGSQLKTIFVVIFFMTCFLIAFYYADDIRLMEYARVLPDYTYTYPAVPGFLVSNPYCQIVDLEAFNPDSKRFYRPHNYTSCSRRKLLTYVTKTDNTATIHVDHEIAPSYAKSGVFCCYSNVSRKYHRTRPDDFITVSNCVPFENNITMPTSIVTVTCQNAKTKEKVYENAHTAITDTDKLKSKLRHNVTGKVTPISVLFVGIDSISRLNLIRSLPHTYSYLEDNGWVSLKGYNKIADNTFPNLMAIFTGMNESAAYKTCRPKEVGKLDGCPFIWKSYSRLGYVTGYAEDAASINTFNYNKKGFGKPATDYYFRPYILAAEKLSVTRIDGLAYCTGPESSGERILNLVKEFAYTLKDYAYFGFFWMNTFSHNEINSPSRMDNRIRDFLEEIAENGVTNKSVVVFLSDHGIRFGKIRYTRTGWFEERLPFIYISFPPWFKKKYRQEYETFLGNVHKLTTPYDLYMTLQHALALSGFDHDTKPSDGCPGCRSLFKPIEYERSCRDAAILQHWCTCAGYSPFNATHDIVQGGVRYLLDFIHGVIHKRKRDSSCAKYALKNVTTSSISQRSLHSNETYLLLVLATKPYAVFEATIALNGSTGEEYALSGDISRLDSYESHSWCTDDSYLRKYCYCH